MTAVAGEEYTFVHELDLEFAFLNEFDAVKPSAYQALFAQLAERHLSFFHADTNETMKHGLSWALISISIDILRPIDQCMRLYATTWYSGRKGPYYRRELVFRNEQGEIMFQGSTFSILMDVKARTVFRKKDLPFSLTVPRDIFCIDANPRLRTAANYEPIESRPIYNSDIDNLGHVNNRRYGDFAYDAFDTTEIPLLKQLKRIDYYFVSELRKGDRVTTEKAVESGEIRVRGRSETKNEIAFEVIFGY